MRWTSFNFLHADWALETLHRCRIIHRVGQIEIRSLWCRRGMLPFASIRRARFRRTQIDYGRYSLRTGRISFDENNLIVVIIDGCSSSCGWRYLIRSLINNNHAICKQTIAMQCKLHQYQQLFAFWSRKSIEL